MITFWFIAVFVFLGSLLPSILRWCLEFIYKISSEELKLRAEFRDMKKELVTIPMVEEFARYAKLQRKMNKVEEEILAKGQSRMDRRESIQTKWTRNFQIVNGLVLVYLSTTQRNEPVFLGLTEWFWPFNHILGFPSGVDGSISTVVWLLICNTASRLLIK